MEGQLMRSEFSKINAGPSSYANSSTIEQLTKVLQYCLDVYEKGEEDPVISDDNYDIMLDILQSRDPSSEFIKKISKSQNDIYAMPSLNKVRSHVESEFTSWYPGHKKDHYQVCDKLDGISAKLVIDKKGVATLTTKGRGTTPQDISNKLPLINFGVDLDNFKNLVLRGEIIIPKKFVSVFVVDENDKCKGSEQKKNQNDSKLNIYKNPRAAVSGIMNNKKVLLDYQGMLDFVVHFKYNENYNSYKQMFEDIDSMGFKTPWNVSYSKLDKNICVEILHNRRIESEYVIDGIVIAQNIKIQPPTIENPKDVIAFKDIAETAQATVIDIAWTVGQYGYLSPVLMIEPIIMNSSTINNVTAHNAKYLIDNQIGIGSIIEISHEITPQVQKVITRAEPKMPSQEFVWNSTGTNILCKEETEEQTIAEVKHFFKTIGVKYLSDGVLKLLNHSGYINIMDIITADRKPLYEIKGLGKSMIDKIYNGMEDSLKSAKLETIMAGSCFFGRNLGERKLKLIVDEIPNIMNENKDQLEPIIMNIKGFSKISTEKFLENFDNFKTFLEDLTTTGKIKNYFEVVEDEVENDENEEDIEDHPIRGLKLVFTNIRPTSIPGLEEKIKKNGGNIMTSVSKNTNIVIYPSSKPESGTITKAKTLGVRLLEMNDFLREFGF